MLASSLFLLFVQKLARLLLCQRIRGSVKTNAKGNAKEISVPHRTAPGAAPPLSARAAVCLARAAGFASGHSVVLRGDGGRVISRPIQPWREQLRRSQQPRRVDQLLQQHQPVCTVALPCGPVADLADAATVSAERDGALKRAVRRRLPGHASASGWLAEEEDQGRGQRRRSHGAPDAAPPQADVVPGDDAERPPQRQQGAAVQGVLPGDDAAGVPQAPRQRAGRLWLHLDRDRPLHPRQGAAEARALHEQRTGQRYDALKCALISPRATGALGDALTRPARRCPWRRNLRARRPAEEGAVPSVLFPVEGHASLRDDLFVMIHPCSVSRCSGTEHGARRVFFLQRDVPTRYGHISHRQNNTHYLTTTHSAPLRLWCGNFSWNLRTPSIHRKTSVDGVGHHASDALSVHGEAELREELDRGDKEAPCVRGEHAALVELGAAALLEGDRRDVRTPPARAGSCAPRQRTGRACSRPTESRSARQPSPWTSP